MSREKALEYVEAVDGKGTAIESMVRNFSMILPDVPASAWTEFFMGVDYSVLLNSVADTMSSSLTDEELDELTALARTPLFQKHLRLYPAMLDELRNDVPKWLRNLRDSKEFDRLGRIMRKAGVPEDVVKVIVDSFAAEAESFDVADHGAGN